MTDFNEYAVPVPKLDGHLIFHIIPKTPSVDIRAYRIAEVMKASNLYKGASETERPALDMWLDALPVLLLCTPHIDFVFKPDDSVPQPVQMFRDWWENTVKAGASDVVVFEQRCELVTDVMEGIWQSAWQSAQMPYVLPASKPGDTLTPEERQALTDANSPLVKAEKRSVPKSGSGRRTSGNRKRS